MSLCTRHGGGDVKMAGSQLLSWPIAAQDERGRALLPPTDNRSRALHRTNTRRLSQQRRNRPWRSMTDPYTAGTHPDRRPVNSRCNAAGSPGGPAGGAGGCGLDRNRRRRRRGPQPGNPPPFGGSDPEQVLKDAREAVKGNRLLLRPSPMTTAALPVAVRKAPGPAESRHSLSGPG